MSSNHPEKQERGGGPTFPRCQTNAEFHTQPISTWSENSRARSVCYRERVKVAFPLFVFVAVTGALFLACFPSLDGLAGGTADAGTSVDAYTPVDSTPASDAPVSVVDAQSGDAEAGPFCATNATTGTFCCDFDTTDLSVFNNVTQFGGGQARIDDAAASSPPQSLLSTIPVVDAAADAGAFSQAYVNYKSSPAQTSVGEASFAFRIEKFSTKEALGLLVLQFVGPDRSHEVRLTVDETQHLILAEFDTKTLAYSVLFTYPTKIVLNAWTRVRLRAEFLAAGSGRADLDVDGTRVVTALSLKPAYASGNLRTSVGATFARAADGWVSRIDDLLISPK